MSGQGLGNSTADASAASRDQGDLGLEQLVAKILISLRNSEYRFQIPPRNQSVYQMEFTVQSCVDARAHS